MSQALEEGKSYYQGRSHQPRVGQGEKSAEAIVGAETSKHLKDKG